jgi:hypothetical protein
MDAKRTRLVGLLGAAVLVVVCTTMIGSPDASAQDKPLKMVTIQNCRNMRFGAILVIGEEQTAIYDTTGLNDCPAKLWDAMDLKAMAKQLGVKAIQKNGPHYWMMDTLTVAFGETKSFGGIKARWGANVETAQLAKASKGSQPYKEFNQRRPCEWFTTRASRSRLTHRFLPGIVCGAGSWDRERRPCAYTLRRV